VIFSGWLCSFLGVVIWRRGAGLCLRSKCLGDGLRRLARGDGPRHDRRPAIDYSPALALLRAGRVREAVASMMMDMRKGPNCGAPHKIHAIGISAAAAGDAAVAGAYIEGFG